MCLGHDLIIYRSFGYYVLLPITFTSLPVIFICIIFTKHPLNFLEKFRFLADFALFVSCDVGKNAAKFPISEKKFIAYKISQPYRLLLQVSVFFGQYCGSQKIGIAHKNSKFIMARILCTIVMLFIFIDFSFKNLPQLLTICNFLKSCQVRALAENPKIKMLFILFEPRRQWQSRVSVRSRCPRQSWRQFGCACAGLVVNTWALSHESRRQGPLKQWKNESKTHWMGPQ